MATPCLPHCMCFHNPSSSVGGNVGQQHHLRLRGRFQTVITVMKSALHADSGVTNRCFLVDGSPVISGRVAGMVIAPNPDR
jgi:hypothetical protein